VSFEAFSGHKTIIYTLKVGKNNLTVHFVGEKNPGGALAIIRKPDVAPDGAPFVAKKS